MSLLLDALDRAERSRREQQAGARQELSLEAKPGDGTGPGAAQSSADARALFDLTPGPQRRHASWLGRGALLLALILLGVGAGWWWLALPPSGVLPQPASGSQAARAPLPAAPLATAPGLAPAVHGSTLPGSTPVPSGRTAGRAGGPVARVQPPVSPTVRVLPVRAAATAPAAVARNADSQTVAPLNHAPAVDIQLFRSHVTAQVDPALLAAWTALREGRQSEAQTAYRQLERDQPSNIDVQLGLARLAAEQNRPAEARQRYQRVLVLDPLNPTAQAGLAVVEATVAGGRLDSRPRAGAAANDPDAQAALAAQLGAAGQWPEAEQAWFEALRTDPTNPDLLFNLAVALDHLGQRAAARQHYRDALQSISMRPGHFDRAQLEARLLVLGAD
jgi:Flp pilus assembly protein TadD